MASLPSGLRNPVSLGGASLTTLGAFAFVAYLIADELGFLASPYAGLFGFVLAPAVFLCGLVLLPLGYWRETRRRSRGKDPWPLPVIDTRQPRTRQVLGAVGLLTIVNLTIVAIAGMGATHYMETDEFCGQVCHEPMRPEFTAHQVPPHANVGCVECHVSPGAEGTIRAKLNGTRQLALLLTGRFARPIPTPAHGLPVAADTCFQCHSPGFPDRDITIVRREFADDEASTEYATTLLMLTSRIHWHARADTVVEYVAADPQRETIPYVRVTAADGSVTEFLTDGTTAQPPGELRRMDCLDCHSRPAHRFASSVGAAADRVLAAASLDRDLPFLRREMVAALSQEYSNETAAFDGISRYLTDRYLSQDPGAAPAVADAIAATQRAYRYNVFPEMGVTWGTYKSQLGHTELTGCMRCHDDGHVATTGRAISMDCEQCHRFQ